MKKSIFFTVCLFIFFAIGCKENVNRNQEEVKTINFVLDDHLSLNDYADTKGIEKKDGFIPTPEIASAIAEIILNNIYGKDVIVEEKPFSVALNGDVWLIEGRLNCSDCKGGVAYIEISKKTGEILKVIHTK